MKSQASHLIRLSFFTLCFAYAFTPFLRAEGDANESAIIRVGETYLGEDGHFYIVIPGKQTVLLTVDRFYVLLGVKLKGFEAFAGYVLNPPDGNSAANIYFGKPPFPSSDEDVRKSPGFTEFQHRDVTAHSHLARWRQWADAEHLQSDTDLDFPVVNGSSGETALLSVGVVANSSERRTALEDSLSAAKLFSTEWPKSTSQLTTIVNTLHLDRSKCRPISHSPDEIRWIDEKNDEAAISIEQDPAVREATKDEATLRSYWRRTAKRSGGGIVAAEWIPAKDGVPAYAFLIAKFPLKKIAGWAYQGVALVPTNQGIIRMDFRSREQGTTGAREAVGIILFMKEQKLSDLNVAAGRFRHDPYDPRFDSEAMFVASDAPKMDAGLPNHPLTRCRSSISAFVASLRSAPLGDHGN